MTLSIGRHRKQSAEIPAPRSLLAPLDERLAQFQAAFPYAHVTIDPHFEPGECDWCALEPAEMTSVRVIGDPADDVRTHQPLEDVQVCIRCALQPRGPIYQAACEARDLRDIRVEVCA